MSKGANLERTARIEDKEGDGHLLELDEERGARSFCLRLPCLHFISNRYLRAFPSHRYRSYMRPVPRPALSQNKICPCRRQETAPALRAMLSQLCFCALVPSCCTHISSCLSQTRARQLKCTTRIRDDRPGEQQMENYRRNRKKGTEGLPRLEIRNKGKIERDPWNPMGRSEQQRWGNGKSGKSAAYVAQVWSGLRNERVGRRRGHDQNEKEPTPVEPRPEPQTGKNE